MGWLIGIILIITTILFLFRFPKQTIMLLGLLILGCFLLWYFAISIPDQNRKALQRNVQVTVKYNLTECGANYPLLIHINNNSNKTISKIEWHLNVYIEGHSTDISGYSNYSCDKILKPGENWESCYSLPSTIDIKQYNVETLQYEIGWKTIDTKN